ncbi:MAG: SBBP repeat-containing protein [Planctomycetaceae bacterium]|nr:SBBP repeat-containing protein [Planctomycetota bacterium]NUN52302.1 SBBP repeat-containing protein [Planctomycetaceae bacterium]
MAARTSPLPLLFESNGGRTDPEAQFLARGRGYTAFLTAQGPVLALRVPTVDPDGENAAAGDEPQAFHRAVLRMRLDGASPDLRLEGERALAGRVNSFLGNDPSKWRTDIPTFGSVRGREAYPGIDVVYAARGEDLEYAFEVRPGADPGRIALAFEGARGMRVDGDGTLVVGTPGGEVRHGAPVAWQEEDGKLEPVAVAFRAGEEGRVSFSVGAFDRGRPLVIDPTITYSTYLGGGTLDAGYGIAVDGSGNAFVVGETNSTDFPTASAYDSSLGSNDVFVAKIGPDGSALVYGTYIGGWSLDGGDAIAVDGGGNAYVTGGTLSPDFPTVSAYDSTPDGVWPDAFVAKIGPAGNTLVYSTVLGGADIDEGRGIAVDGSGNAYVTGRTQSADFPTASAYDSTLGGASDAFVAKLGPAGNTLVYSSFLGGGDVDFGSGIAVDAGGKAFVTGRTGSADFPAASAYDSTLGGTWDAFVAKVGNAGNTLVYGTYLGGAGDGEQGRSIAVDGSGNAYVTGQTDSTDFPTASAHDSTHNGSHDAFVAKIGPAGDSLVFGTYLGGAGSDDGYGIAVNGSGNACVTGTTESTDFPTASADDSTLDGAADAFVAKLGPAGDTLVYGTYLGGAAYEAGYGIAVDGSGNAFVTGATFSADLPTASAYDSSLGGTFDAFVVGFGRPAPQAPTGLVATPVTSTRVDLSWTDKSDEETGFEVERSVEGGAFAPLVTLAADAVSHSDTGCEPRRVYSYRVRATSATVPSSFADSGAVTTFGTMTLATLKGALKDLAPAGRDAFSASGTVDFNAFAPDGLFDPATDGLELAFGAPGDPFVLAIPAASPGWKKARDGKLTWKSARRTTPKVALVIDLGRSKFSARASRLDLPATPTGLVRVAFRAGNDAAGEDAPWTANPRKPGVLSKP